MSKKSRPAAARPTTKAASPGTRLDRALFSGAVLALVVLPFAIDLRLATPTQGQERFLEVSSFALAFLHFGSRALGARSEEARPDLASLCAAGVGALLLLSALFAPNRPYALASSLLSLSGIALFLVLRSVARARDLLESFGGLLAVQGAVLAGYALAQTAGLELLPYVPDPDAKSRAVATFGNPNFLASFLGPALFLSLAWALERRGIARTAGLAAAALVLLALVATQARAVLLGVLLGIVCVVAILVRRVLADPKTMSRVRRRVLVAAAALAVLGALLASPRLVAGFSYANLESRLYFFRIAADARAPAWPLGLGRGGFAHAFWSAVDEHQKGPEGPLFTRNLESLAARDGRALDPGGVHDDSLELLAEGGPFALFLHLALVGHVLVEGLRRAVRGDDGKARRAALLTAGLLVSLVDSALGFPLALPASLAVFWLLIATLAPQQGAAG